MTAEVTTGQFMVLGVKGNPIPITLQYPMNEKDNVYILNSFEKALSFYIWLYENHDGVSANQPIRIVMLNDIIGYEANNTGPFSDYAPITIENLKNAQKNAIEINNEFGPECSVCKEKVRRSEFVSECWMQIILDEHGNCVWVCPACVEKEYNKKVS